MSDDNFYSSMYGGDLYHGKDVKASPTKPVSAEKMASRVIGGLKAQNAHTKTVEIDGQLHSFPRAEYVEQLETQLKEARKKLQDMENKMNRLIKANNRIMNKLRDIDRDLANKIDAK
jgi:exosome complex RNA-binding protein Rrp4